MTQSSNDKDCSSGACPVEKPEQGKLVRSVDLPLLGNPYPPKDVIQSDNPSSVELGVRSVRTSLQPYLSPVCKAYRTTSDVLSIGVAHSQSALQSLGENQGTVYKAAIISGAGLLGLTLARRKGLFKKLLYGSTLFGAALAVCYPQEAKDNGELLWIMARNKLPTLFAQQYQNLSQKMKPSESTNSDSPTKN